MSSSSDSLSITGPENRDRSISLFITLPSEQDWIPAGPNHRFEHLDSLVPTCGVKSPDQPYVELCLTVPPAVKNRRMSDTGCLKSSDCSKNELSLETHERKDGSLSPVFPGMNAWAVLELPRRGI